MENVIFISVLIQATRKAIQPLITSLLASTSNSLLGDTNDQDVKEPASATHPPGGSQRILFGDGTPDLLAR